VVEVAASTNEHGGDFREAVDCPTDSQVFRGALAAEQEEGHYPVPPSMAAISAADVDTAPNTPPCFLIIEIAASWFRGSVAAQQSCGGMCGGSKWGHS